MKGVDRWAAFFVWVFFESVPLERFREIMFGVRDGSEWVRRFLSSSECMRGLWSVVKVIHSRYLERNGSEGVWSLEDSLQLAVQELLERVSEKLDLSRTLPEQLSISFMWIFHRLKRHLLSEKLEQLRRSPDFPELFVQPDHGEKGPSWEPESPSFALVLFGRQ